MAASIRAAIIGLDRPAQTILEGLQSAPGLKLVGLADTHKERLAEFAKSTDLPTYDDRRLMLVETKPQFIFVNVPRHQEAEVLALAAELGVHVWKPYPLGRNFDEAVSFVQLIAKAKLGLYVGSPYRFGGGFGRLCEWLPRVGRVHLIQDEFLVPESTGGPITGWRASKAQAGGGVLLDGAYPSLEVMTSQFGLPAQVYCEIAGSLGTQTDGPPYETEDLAMLCLTFGSGTAACSAALRVSARHDWRTAWHGPKGTITFKPGCVSFESQAIWPPEVFRFPVLPARQYTIQAGELVANLRDEQPASSAARDHLPVMAIIEAAYLSARTGQPESPAQFYELHHLTPPALPVIGSSCV